VSKRHIRYIERNNVSVFVLFDCRWIATCNEPFNALSKAVIWAARKLYVYQIIIQKIQQTYALIYDSVVYRNYVASAYLFHIQIRPFSVEP